MTKNYLQIAYEGVATADPEMRYMPNGKPVTSLTVAVNNDWQDDSGTQHKQVYWMRTSFFGKLAEVVNQYVKKGGHILCFDCVPNATPEGNPRVWTAQDGTPRANFEFTAKGMRLLGGKSGGNDGSGYAPVENQASAGPAMPDEDIPF